MTHHCLAQAPNNIDSLRKVCPGASFAERVLWINIAMLLWMFDIRKTSDVDPKTGRAFEYSDSDEMFTPGVS